MKKFKPKTPRQDKSDLWRVGRLYIFGRAFGEWIDTTRSVTIRPQESIKELCKMYGRQERMNEHCEPETCLIEVMEQ